MSTTGTCALAEQSPGHHRILWVAERSRAALYLHGEPLWEADLRNSQLTFAAVEFMRDLVGGEPDAVAPAARKIIGKPVKTVIVGRELVPSCTGITVAAWNGSAGGT